MIDLPIPPGRLLRAHDVHRRDCGCETCEPYRPDPARPLSPAWIGVWMIAGIVTGNTIAFAVDPQGSAQALLDVARSFAS